MEFYKEILARALEKQTFICVFPELNLTAKELVEIESYQALEKIRDIIADDTLEDPECFMKIDEIVSLLWEMGGGYCSRHDF